MGTLTKSEPNNLSLIERARLKKSRPVLLCDCSGSMNEECEPGRSKLDALKDIVKANPATSIYAFNHECSKVKNLGCASGSTVMSRAFSRLKSDSIKKAIMITDGICDVWDQESALKEAQGLELSIIYVGPGEKSEFLDKLAKSCGGFCTLEDLSNKELEGKITLLLNAGQSGTINL